MTTLFNIYFCYNSSKNDYYVTLHVMYACIVGIDAQQYMLMSKCHNKKCTRYEWCLCIVQGLGTLAKKKERKKVLSHHLFFCMRDFSYHLGEDAEVYFSLYDSQKGKFIR